MTLPSFIEESRNSKLRKKISDRGTTSSLTYSSTIVYEQRKVWIPDLTISLHPIFTEDPFDFKRMWNPPDVTDGILGKKLNSAVNRLIGPVLSLALFKCSHFVPYNWTLNGLPETKRNLYVQKRFALTRPRGSNTMTLWADRQFKKRHIGISWFNFGPLNCDDVFYFKFTETQNLELAHSVLKIIILFSSIDIQFGIHESYS